MSKYPEYQSHIFQYICSVKKRLVAYRKKILALIFILALIGTLYAAFVEVNQLQSAVQFIEQHSNFFQVVASFALVIASTYFSGKMYKNAIKMAEKPAMAELCRFLISPLEKYLLPQVIKGQLMSPSIQNLREGCRKLYLEFFLMEKSPSKIFPFPFGRILWTKFFSILEKMNKKEKWGQEEEEFNRSCDELTPRIDKLEEELKELIRRYVEEVREKYETIEEIRRKYPDFQELLDKLVDESYAYYIKKKRNQSLEDLSWYYFDDLFNRIEQELNRDLEEIDILWTKRTHHASNLFSLLEEVREYLEKEYKLAPLEQVPLERRYLTGSMRAPTT
jgi:hypothetical protein